jgi:hypothetical protein
MKQYKKLFAVLTLLCFAMTFLPVAAFAAVDSVECSVFTTTDSAKIGKDVKIKLDFGGQLRTETATTVYVWFVKDGSNVPAISVTSVDGFSQDSIGIFAIPANKVAEGTEYKFQFDNAGTYTVAAALSNPASVSGTTAEKIKNVEKKITTLSSKKSVEITSSTESDKYTLQLVDNAGLPFGIAEGAILANNGTTTIGAGANVVTSQVNNHLEPNGVASDDITFKLLDENGKAVKGATVKLYTSNTNCIVNKTSVVTDSVGQFKFNITLTEESPNTDFFTIYIESGSYSAKLKVTASSTSAYDISFTQIPSGPVSVDDVTAGSNFGDYLNIATKDVNGNFVMPFAMQPGGAYAEPAFAGVQGGYGQSGFAYSTVDYTKSTWGKSAADYVSIISKPAASDLENEDVWMSVTTDAPFQSTLYFAESLVVGDYTFRITLANGNYKDLSITVAEMDTPVQITATPKTAVVEVGGRTKVTFKLLDANGVSKKAIIDKDIDVAVSGYAVAKTQTVATGTKNAKEIFVKNDEKYLSSEISVVATSDRYNLVGQTTIKVTDGNAFIMTPVKEATINTPTDLMYMLRTKDGLMCVNSKGDDSSQMQVVAGQTSFVVLDKPEGATVNFDARAAGGAGTSLGQQGYGQARIECDTPGEVTLQMTYGVKTLTADDTWTDRYYTGTMKINFTNGSSGKTVVMSIGSNEIVVNDAKATIDAAPLVQNSRTYVPFRALAEAFGAEVSYDEATQAVTATLGSKTVVMTIGSATYTVNGAEQTADVAPFINGSRTMVPVRFVAEAFGSTVTPTYDENGATADILFSL